MAHDGNTTTIIKWDVPLSQFQVDLELYRPRPALFSPIAQISTDCLMLQFQLSLEQGRDEARVFLHYRTPGIPNQGVTYSISALKNDSFRSTNIPLTMEIRQALARYSSTSSTSTLAETMKRKRDSNRGRKGQKSTSSRTGGDDELTLSDELVKSLIWDGGQRTVKLNICITLNCALWNPRRILNNKIRAWQQEAAESGAFDPEPGLIGERLWTDVVILPEQKDPVPPYTDLVFACPNGERIVAHRAVLAAYSQPFRQMASLQLSQQASSNRPAGGILVVNLSGVGPAALWEVLYFIYLRQMSSRFYRVPLNEILEASRILGLPDIVRLEVEKVFILILEQSNRDRMKILADKYGLKIIQNMLKKSFRDMDDFGQTKNVGRNYISMEYGRYLGDEQNMVEVF